MIIFFCLGDREETSDINIERSASAGSLFTKNQLLNFDYPIIKFGQEEQSLNPSWYNSFPWLHYELGLFHVVWNMYFSGEKRQLNTIMKKVRCFSFYWMLWKKALEKFRKHENSNCHLEAASMSVILDVREDIEDMLSDTLSQEERKVRELSKNF